MGGIYLAITGALDADTRDYADETLLAFADDADTDEATAGIYRGLVECIDESETPKGMTFLERLVLVA